MKVPALDGRRVRKTRNSSQLRKRRGQMEKQKEIQKGKKPEA